MHKQMGSILLVAGTCIGSGMIALPMVLAKIGIIPSIALMLCTWLIMYYTSLINVELNLQAGQGLALGELGRRYSGKIAEWIGAGSLKLLTYSLLAVFIYGGSSIVQKLLASKANIQYSFNSIASTYAILTTLLLLFPIKWIDYVNRMLFVSLLAIVCVLITGLVLSVEWSNLPLFSEQYTSIPAWASLLPVVFTSFGFQVIFHTLTNYCDKDAKMLKQAFFWGSLIPAIIYILWTSSILNAVHHENPEFYAQMAQGKAGVGELIQVLSNVSDWQAIQLMVWWISFLAIATSVIGVGVGLFDSIRRMLDRAIFDPKMRKAAAAIATTLPAYLTVIFVPNAFITVLGFAGMILAIIAVLLPAYLLWKLKPKKLFFDELKTDWLTYLSIIFAIGVILSEFYSMLAAI
jgi:tyrosine-specific transport protein